MPEKIETYPFLQWDIKALVMGTDLVVASGAARIDDRDAANTADAILKKVTDFINENYTPKP